jgi:geranylgeranyl diphosphate synthase type I
MRFIGSILDLKAD